MASFSTISIRFNADLKQFSSQMQNAQRRMQKMGKQMQNIGSGLTLGVTLPVLGIGAAAVKAASDAEETASKFQTVFRDISDAAQQSADELRNSYGLSRQASQQLLSDTGDLLTGFGFTQEAALDLSSEVNKLAVDLASFTNYSGGAEGASQALTKALLGERESVKSLGISILETDVQARVLENTQKGLTFESERQAKAFATLQLAQEQSKNAIGDYARTSQSFANQMRLLRARVNDVAVEFGEILLPYVTKLANFVGGLIEKFSGLDKSTKKIIVVVALFAAALGPVLLAIGTLLTILPTLGTAFTVLTGPIGLVIAAIAGIAYVVYKHWDTIKKHMVDLQNYFIDLYNESVVFRIAIEYIIFIFKSWWSVAKAVFGGIWDIVKNLGSFIVDTFKNSGAAIKAILTGDFGALPGILKKQGDLIARNFGDNVDDIGKQINTLTDNIKKDFDNAIAAVTTKKKIEFVKENVDATPIQEKVAEAVQAGMQEGAGGRAKVSAISTLEAMPVIQQGPLDIVADKMPEQVQLMNEQQLQAMANAQAFNEGFTSIIHDAAAGAASGFGEIIGAMAAGNFSMASLGQLIGQTLGDMAVRIGKMAIGIGLAVEGIKKALQSLAGPVAIAAGIALVALGTLAKNALGKMSSGGGDMTKFANGGLVYGPTVGLMGEYSGAKTNPEVIAPLDKLKEMIQDAVGGSGGGKGEFTLRGQDLILAMDRAGAYKSRRG